jgi:hypothetical protein
MCEHAKVAVVHLGGVMQVEEAGGRRTRLTQPVLVTIDVGLQPGEEAWPAVVVAAASHDRLVGHRAKADGTQEPLSHFPDRPLSSTWLSKLSWSSWLLLSLSWLA